MTTRLKVWRSTTELNELCSQTYGSSLNPLTDACFVLPHMQILARVELTPSALRGLRATIAPRKSNKIRARIHTFHIIDDKNFQFKYSWFNVHSRTVPELHRIHLLIGVGGLANHASV